MSTHIKIISPQEIKLFDLPPKFNSEERKIYFYLPTEFSKLLSSIFLPINKIGLILQIGYFKATNKFFKPKNFFKKDIEYISSKYKISISHTDLDKYKSSTFLRHQDAILKILGFNKFNSKVKLLLINESLKLSFNQTKPSAIFLSLLSYLKAKKIETPTYNTLSEIITNSLKQYESNILSSIENNITNGERDLLNKLLEVKEEYFSSNQGELKLKRYKLTLIKKSNQSIKPSQIKGNVNDLKIIHELFLNLTPIITRLKLSPEMISYYAQVVLRSRTFQIIRREEEKKYLLLIAFVIHQYYKLSDTMIDILLKSVLSTQNSTMKEHKENIYLTRASSYKTIDSLTNSLKKNLNLIEVIKNILDKHTDSSDNKIKAITNIISNNEQKKDKQIEEKIQAIKKDKDNTIKGTDYFKILESKSIRLKNRVKAIVQVIIFDSKTSNKNIIKAINYYKINKGSIGNNPPTEFLGSDQIKLIFDQDGALRKSLYKVFFFEVIESAIKSGSLNLTHSYQYKSFDNYLIPKETWANEKSEILTKSGLKDFENYDKVESQLKNIIEKQYKTTNHNINNGNNKFINFKKSENFSVKTPGLNKDEENNLIELFPKNKYLSLFEILSTINKATKFTDSFEHWKIKHNREKPQDKTFFAGIIGHGCNLGIRKTAKISKSINQNELENTVTWYFDIDNINSANNKILSLVDKLKLSKVFKDNKQKIHSSSDGQKFGIAVESLNSNYSYKYFGKGKGVTVYSFIDESHKLFYSTVISSSEREASYVIDGLMHNDVVKSDIHSTDTHGYNELIFGISHLLGISFAPRIKNFQKQTLYSFDDNSEFTTSNFKISPDKKIKTDIIKEYWDDILRFIATIKLKHTTASQLFKRLSSYSKQHPLYKAMKEFGRIIKTIFLLKYIDDLKLRQQIEKQLNKLESSNKFGKAIFHGNNQEFQHATKGEQLIVDGCKRLIENTIICWNYLYLTQRVIREESEQQRIILIKSIKNKSVIFWHHVNLVGEYDFDDKNKKSFHEFDIPKLLQLNIA